MTAEPVATFKTGYFDKALFDLSAAVKLAASDLKGFKFDTLVGTGFSGAILVPALALRMRKNFVLIRKANDDSHHNGRLIGKMGRRWIFVDDFTSSGATRKRVLKTIGDENVVDSTHVADYYYTHTWDDNPFTRLRPIIEGNGS